MPTKQDVITKARAFLEAIAREARARLGENLTTQQEAVWWSESEPNEDGVIVHSQGSVRTLRSAGYQREVLNAGAVNFLYQVHLAHADFREQTDLNGVVIAAGVQPQEIQFGFLMRLLGAWYKLPEPFDLTDDAGQALLADFADAVIDGGVRSKYRDAIISLNLHGTPISFEEGVAVRPISDEELWELGSDTRISLNFDVPTSLSKDWCILEIELNHQIDASSNVNTEMFALREAVIADLAINLEQGFITIPIGVSTNFGTSSLQFGSRRLQELGKFPGWVPVDIDAQTRMKLEELWPRFKGIMQSQSDGLRLPLRRLIDGLGRDRLDDSIVDYSIGLEALFTHGIRQELRYRFSLRGSVILDEAGANRMEKFKELQGYYDARSAIVHGENITALNLTALRNQGETNLRQAWMWYFDQGTSLEEATLRLDLRILETS